MKAFRFTALTALLTLALACSSGSKKASVTLEPFAYDKLGLHILTVEQTTNSIAFPTLTTFQRAANFGRFAIAEFFLDRWQNGALKPHLIEQARLAHQAGLAYIVRLEDNNTYAINGNAPRYLATQEWFDTTWLPYVRDVVTTLRPYTFGYQIGNEIWNVDWTMKASNGKDISASEYVALFTATKSEILKLQPNAVVIMTGMTYIASNPRYRAKLDALMNAGILNYSDLNLHLYPPSLMTNTEVGYLTHYASLANAANRALWITEVNTHDQNKSDVLKLRIIQNAYSSCVHTANLSAFLVFVANATDGLRGWTVLGTPLETMIEAKTIGR